MSTLGIVGSRTCTDKDYVFSAIDGYMRGIEAVIGKVNTICSGGASGVDSLAEQYASERGLNLIVYHADWEKNGKSAGHVRNHKIVETSDFVLAIWDGKSPGTKNTISLCKKYGIPHIVEIVDQQIDENRGRLPMLNKVYYNPGKQP